MGRRYGPDEVEMLAELEAMAAAAEGDAADDFDDFDGLADGDEDDDNEESWSFEEDPGEPQAYGNPLSSRKVWGILVVIFVAIAVAVLYVYQAGDPKTILGNQPIPAGQGVQLGAGAATAAAPVPVPVGGGMVTGGLATRCPVCGNTGLPLCSKDNAVMQPIDRGSGLYVCPTCGAVGMPICPRCGGHMASGFDALSQGGTPLAQSGGARR